MCGNGNGAEREEPRWYVDVDYRDPPRYASVFGPFTERWMAEATVLALAARSDVLGATLRQP